MGLDQYININGQEYMYFRKHSQLHTYMIKYYNVPDFNKGDTPLPITLEICDDIINLVKNKTMPNSQGFFWGDSSNGYYDEATIETFTNIKEYLETIPDTKFTYECWW